MSTALNPARPATSGADDRLRHPQVDVETQRLYQRLVDGEFRDGPAGSIAFCVYTTKLHVGRGDIIVAAGLARSLVELGWGVRFIPRWRWKRPMPRVDVVVSLLEGFDPSVVPQSTPVIAWVRNQTDLWKHSPTLGLYDSVLASSELSLAAVREYYRGPTGLLPIGVDHALFHAGNEERSAVTTSVNHWSADRDLHRALTEAPSPVPLTWYGDPKYLGTPLRHHSAGAVSFFALPDAYRRSLLVLDDMNTTTLPYGSMNSRVFEALGAGALPITNGALGLAELGLADVPVYRSSGQLRDLIARGVEDAAATAERAGRLRAVILDRHTFAHRAAAFLDLLPAARERSARRRTTIACYPPSPDNPFPRMLYADAVEAGACVVPVGDPGRAVRDDGGRLDHQILHIHWTSPLLQPAEGPFEAYRRLERIKDSLRERKARGGRLIWTVHNLLPHDGRYRALEIELGRFLAQEADVIHVLGESTVAAAAPLFELPPDKVRLIRHCSYRGVYPDFLDRSEARRRLGLQDPEIALLLFGELRPYKGVHLLLPAFEQLLAEDPRLRLLVAGRANRAKKLQPWLTRIQDHPRVIAHVDFVPDSEVQVWLRAADVAVLPYPSILNSGTLHLAQTFGLPVVAPATGEVGRALDPGHAVAFRPKSSEDLQRAIRQAVDELRTPQARASALAAADRYPPSTMSADFLALLRELEAP